MGYLKGNLITTVATPNSKITDSSGQVLFTTLTTNASYSIGNFEVGSNVTVILFNNATTDIEVTLPEASDLYVYLPESNKITIPSKKFAEISILCYKKATILFKTTYYYIISYKV